jgi:Mn2+/Fe2+ NRAMP family transporter
MSVLGIGLLFGVMQFQPVPVIILAQALNGVILPVIAVILFLLMNNDRVLPKADQNGKIQNLLTAIVVWLSILLGLSNMLRALSGVFEFSVPGQVTLIITSGFLFLTIIILVGWMSKND